MSQIPTIQKISSAYVARALVQQPYGTYIIRYQTSNDETISSIQVNRSSPATSTRRDQYVVLSVRVDETVYKCLVMNYRLTLMKENGEENRVQLLKQYRSEQNKREKLTKLSKELIVPREDLSWTVEPREFDGLDFDQGQFGGKNNTGASKAIWHTRNKDDVKIFIKRLDKKNNHIENELKILKQLCFFSITTLYGHYSDRTYEYLVLADGGKSLISMCPLSGRRRTSKMCRIANIGFQIANAMMYLEKKNIVHRDLTASNVLVDSYGFIRIADFGHAIQKEEGKNNLSSSVTKSGQWKFQVRFLAPECISKSQADQSSDRDYASFSSKSDVWAFGLLLIQLMLPKPSTPYPHIANDKDLPRRIVIDHEVHPQPAGCDFDVYCVLRQCWAYEPINRISFIELREKMKMLVSILN